MSAASIIGFLGLAGLSAAYLVLFLRRGLEYRIRGAPRYLSDPDALALPPALLGYVWRMGHVSSHDVSATILDLIDRRWIEFDDARGPAHLVLLNGGENDVMAHERALLALLFEDVGSDGKVAIADLDEYSKDHVVEFRERLAAFKQAIAAWASERGVFEREGAGAASRARVLALLTAVWAPVMGLIAKDVWLIAFGIAASTVMYVCAPAMWRRSRAFATMHSQAAALRRYLMEFGRMSEKPAAAVVLWSRYLVFAEVFGIAGQVRDQLLKGTGEVGGPFGSLSFVLDCLPILVGSTDEAAHVRATASADGQEGDDPG